VRRPPLPGVVLALALGASGLARTQTRPPPAPQPPQTPTFRGVTELVAVDFLAIDADGRPIADLKPGELTLTVDGKPRDIQSLKFLQLAPANPPAKGSVPFAKAAPVPFGSNVQRDAGRTIILLFHHTSIEPGDERLARDAMLRLLDTLTARDRVALITFSQGAVLVDLTTDHDRVRAALQTVTGHAPRAGDSNQAAADQTARYVLKDLVAIINGFKAIEGPKTVILVTQKMPELSPMTRDSTLDDYADLATAASRVSAHFFIVQPYAFGAMSAANHYATDLVGNTTTGAASRVGTGIEDLAGVVGGELFSLSGTADTVMDRVARESSAYYLLGFTPTAAEMNGKNHSIGLSVGRPGVTIRARPEFVIAKPGVAPKGKPGAPITPETFLKDAASHTDLPLHAVAYTFRAPPGSGNLVKVLVAVESPAAGTVLKAAAFALVDPKGRIAAEWSADAQDLAARPVVSAMNVKAGTYRVRVSARDASERQGAVDYEFEAALTRVGGIEVGALMVGLMRNTDFQPRFTFGTELEATAYTELYGADARGADIRFELARTSDGPAMETIRATISATKDADRWVVTGAIPIATLASGDVVVRAVIVFDTSTGQIVRTLRKR
jgi:VWFA-related protein